MATRKLIVEIVGDSRSLDKALGKAESRTETFQRRLKTGLKAGAIGAAITGGVVVAQQLKASVDAALEAEKAQLRLNQAFKSAGVVQRDYAKAQKEINRVSREAALDDEDLSDSLAQITRSTGDVKKGLEGMGLAANIARARNISLAAATKIVERAYLGQDTALRRVGVVVPKVTAATDKLKAKEKQLRAQLKGSVGERRKIIQAQLDDLKAQRKQAAQLDKTASAQKALTKAQRVFAGSAAKFGDSAAGSQERLAVAIENLQEKIGAKLLPVLQKGALRLTELIEQIEDDWPKIQKVIDQSLKVIRPIIDRFVKQIKGIANVIEGVVRTIDAIKNGDWARAWDGIKQVAVDGVLAIVKSVVELPAKILASLAGAAWNGLERIGSTIKDAALRGLQGLGDLIVQQIKNAINRLIQLLNKAIGAINKIPLLPDIPKIPEIGTTRTPSPKDVTGPRSRSGPSSNRSTLPPGVSGPVTVTTTVTLDGEPVARNTTKQQQKTQRRNPRAKSGPNSAFR